MSYKVQDIPGMIECFKLVTPKRLESNWGFLCLALKRTSHPSRGKCLELVREMLGWGCSSLEGWHTHHTGREIHYPARAWKDNWISERARIRMQWIEKIISDLKGYQKCHTK